MKLLSFDQQGMVPGFILSCQILIDAWKNLVGSEEAYELDIMPEMQALTAYVIYRAVFGSSYKEGKKVFEQALLIMKASLSFYIPGFRSKHRVFTFYLKYNNL